MVVVQLQYSAVTYRGNYGQYVPPLISLSSLPVVLIFLKRNLKHENMMMTLWLDVIATMCYSLFLT